MYLAAKILKFLSQLELDQRLPKGVVAMNPYRDPVAWSLCEKFYRQYYSDNHHRTLILGINPGRFGGGVTGIPFTDPIKLDEVCGISNPLPRKKELSADFIYQVIQSWGGAPLFYQQFYITSVSPIGFTLDGKNLNYYDHPKLEKQITAFIVHSLRTQLEFGIRTDVCFCLGESGNFDFLSQLNSTHHFFKQIIPLPHPRFIMQYRLKKSGDYVAHYIGQLKAVQQ